MSVTRTLFEYGHKYLNYSYGLKNLNYYCEALYMAIVASNRIIASKIQTIEKIPLKVINDVY